MAEKKHQVPQVPAPGGAKRIDHETTTGSGARSGMTQANLDQKSRSRLNLMDARYSISV